MMNVRFMFYFLLFLLGSYIAYEIPLKYSYVDLKDYLTLLLTVSSMIFTLMGIWIAFLYPNALRRLVDPVTLENADFSETLSETRRLEGLVGSVLKSAFVVIMIMLIFIMKLLLSKTNIYFSYFMYIKPTTLSFVFLLSILQIESIVYVIYSNVMFINDLHQKREDREANADI